MEYGEELLEALVYCILQLLLATYILIGTKETQVLFLMIRSDMSLRQLQMRVANGAGAKGRLSSICPP